MQFWTSSPSVSSLLIVRKDMIFAMTKNALPGEYQAMVTVSNRVLATTVARPFRVQN